MKSYLEPFFGSGAVLLARPNYRPGEHMETVNDKDGFVANVWRALQHDPDGVAKVCDWPVNHADLSARKTALVANEGRLLEHLIADPDWYDVKMAGYWVWAASCWIGRGLTRLNAMPNVSDGGSGVHRVGQMPNVSDGGSGVHRVGQIPHVTNRGKGVHKLSQHRPSVAEEEADVQSPYNTNLYIWFRQLAERLRYVRVVCGDWTRVCGGDWQDDLGIVGIFLDPPYGVADRDQDLYHHDSSDLAPAVMAWALERGKKPTYRIVLAGYEEYQELCAEGWTTYSWQAKGGYSNTSRDKDGNQSKANRKRETLYLSPYCSKQGKLEL